jgi:hypothetical protein
MSPVRRVYEGEIQDGEVDRSGTNVFNEREARQAARASIAAPANQQRTPKERLNPYLTQAEAEPPAPSRQHVPNKQVQKCTYLANTLLNHNACVLQEHSVDKMLIDQYRNLTVYDFSACRVTATTAGVLSITRKLVSSVTGNAAGS